MHTKKIPDMILRGEGGSKLTISLTVDYPFFYDFPHVVSYSLLLWVYFLVLLTIAVVVCKRVVSVSVGGAD